MSSVSCSQKKKLQVSAKAIYFPLKEMLPKWHPKILSFFTHWKKNQILNIISLFFPEICLTGKTVAAVHSTNATSRCLYNHPIHHRPSLSQRMKANLSVNAVNSSISISHLIKLMRSSTQPFSFQIQPNHSFVNSKLEARTHTYDLNIPHVLFYSPTFSSLPSVFSHPNSHYYYY